MDIAELTAALKELRNEALSELTKHRHTTKDIWGFSAEILEVIEKWYAIDISKIEVFCGKRVEN